MSCPPVAPPAQRSKGGVQEPPTIAADCSWCSSWCEMLSYGAGYVAGGGQVWGCRCWWRLWTSGSRFLAVKGSGVRIPSAPLLHAEPRFLILTRSSGVFRLGERSCCDRRRGRCAWFLEQIWSRRSGGAKWGQGLLQDFVLVGVGSARLESGRVGPTSGGRLRWVRPQPGSGGKWAVCASSAAVWAVPGHVAGVWWLASSFPER